MLKLLKSSLLFLLFINLSACSYSPESLKENYNDLVSDFSKDLKAPFDLSPQQSAMIDDYSTQLFKWHRHSKLPAYAQNFSVLAKEVQQNNPDVLIIRNSLADIDKIPHITQATHLNKNMEAFSKSLDKGQISQLEEFLDDEYQSDALEIKKEDFTVEVSDNVKSIFQFMNLTLNTNQLTLISTYAKHFHDIRHHELHSEKDWNQQMIALLRQKDHPDFSTRFAYLWKAQDSNLTTNALKFDQQNTLLQAKLIKALIISLTPEQRNQLTNQLISISNTLSEMANE